jgi:trk/ktr system potassium uptake protein
LSATARARRTLRPRRAGVDIAPAVSVVGTLLKYLSLAFLFPTGIALGYDEPVWPFLAAGAATGILGFALERSTPSGKDIGPREGFLVIALVWLIAPACGALPYLFSGESQLSSPVDAYFEAMSGFATCSSSVLTDVEGLTHSLAMWRQFTVWLGGIGILVLALAVLPRLRVGGRQLFELEVAGPAVEPLAVTIREAARRFLVLYVGITVLEILSLSVLAWTGLDKRMSVYEAVAHTFTTLGTGGFSTRAHSFEEFGAASQWVVIVFLIVAGTNYALMYRALLRRRPRLFARDDEFRLYIVLLALASVVILAELWSEGIARGEEAVRFAVFQTVSIMTTTGFANTDFNQWTALTSVVLVGLMVFGPSAGSTGGSIKVVRHMLIGRILRRELAQTVHPELVTPVRLNGVSVDEGSLRAVFVFVLLYVGLFALGALLLVADAARTDLDLSPFEAIAAAATTLGNAGPGFGFAGPIGSFDPFGDVSKLIMTGLMYLGRLEIIPVAVLFTRAYWRR